ncbi:GNAT family N-acetyltransferase [Mucilaginibacter aquatilis]|uniref:GNAT family N-acetyltransferase n=1 Tax=Mucilaginibacter aquatilis TaxID=1517760 RepID=A0A6I4IQS3_9SPHI|nr:GNAT family N-acetyltransferase [Mucilaginibacter aquatilis]MVN92203.1 GNAT family N-acetyltransferase [Mucilaginibacter aquatilis]
MSIILETERLVLRKFSINDAPFIVELLNTPTWKQYIGDRGIQTIAEANNYLVKVILMNYAINGFGLYMMESKESGQAIGMCGLLKREYLAYADLGYALLPQFEGNGYASEAALATINYAFNVFGWPVVAAITQPDNQRSIKLLTKLGFIYAKPVWVDGRELDLYTKASDA